jgi:hypothetical protein
VGDVDFVPTTVDLFGDAFRGVPVDVEHRDTSAFRCHPLAGGTAYAGRASGHDRALSLEKSHGAAS